MLGISPAFLSWFSHTTIFNKGWEVYQGTSPLPNYDHLPTEGFIVKPWWWKRSSSDLVYSQLSMLSMLISTGLTLHYYTCLRLNLIIMVALLCQIGASRLCYEIGSSEINDDFPFAQEIMYHIRRIAISVNLTAVINCQEVQMDAWKSWKSHCGI